MNRSDSESRKLSLPAYLLNLKTEKIMSVSLFDLLKPTIKNAGGGGGIKSEIIIALEEDIDMNSFPAREADGVTILTDIPMKTGKYMHTLYMTQGTIKPGQKKLKGSNNDCGGFELTLEGSYTLP